MKIKLFSFFSGIGLLDLGFDKEDCEIVFSNECHEPFLKAYKYARQRLRVPEPIYGYHCGDIEELLLDQDKTRASELVSTTRRNGSVVGFIGGPPCPDFSEAGKHRGREGNTGRLSQVYVELIGKLVPDFFLFENVRGMWRTSRHRAFYEELKSNLQSRQYLTTDRLVNAIEYGVPQNRDRVFLFGVLRALFDDLYPAASNDSNEIQEGLFPWGRYAKYGNDAASQFNWPQTEPFVEDSSLPPPPDVPLELTVERWFRQNDVINHPNSIHHFQPREGLARFRSIPEGDTRGKSFKRLHRWRYSPTAAYGNNEVHLHPYKPRRLSVAEALAIQSLPQGFELPPNMPLSKMFKGIGNGVPFLLARMIARSIRDFLDPSSQPLQEA